jgi:hypothetical protein
VSCVPNVASVSELSILTAPLVFSNDYIERIHNTNTMHVKKEFAICHRFLSLIEQRKNKEKIHCHLRYGHLVTVNQN